MKQTKMIYMKRIAAFFSIVLSICIAIPELNADDDAVEETAVEMPQGFPQQERPSERGFEEFPQEAVDGGISVPSKKPGSVAITNSDSTGTCDQNGITGK
jgi:hypothetical protein